MSRLLITLKVLGFTTFVGGLGFIAGSHLINGHSTNGADAIKPRSTQHQTVTSHTEVTIYYDNYGFDPNQLTVPRNTKIDIKNISTQGTLLFEGLASPAPQNPALSLGTIPEQQTKSFTVSESGVWQYEGNNQPEIRGVIGTGALSLKPVMYPDSAPKSGHLNIVYDDYGFMPNQIAVPVGTTRTLTNLTDDTQPGPTLFMQSAGDASRNPALDLGLMQKQSSKSFTLTQKGTWHLENVDQPAEKAFAQITAF